MNRVSFPAQSTQAQVRTAEDRGKRLQTRQNQHLRNHRGFSVAFVCQWTFSGMFQRNFTSRRYFPKDCHLPSGFYWNYPMDVQWHFPMNVHFCEIWCVIFCPEKRIGCMNVNRRRIQSCSGTTILWAIMKPSRFRSTNMNRRALPPTLHLSWPRLEAVNSQVGIGL